MIRVLSWNIQNGKGVDGEVSLKRIADVINAMGTPDVISLQEVSRGLALPGCAGKPDQVAELSALFPDYETIFGVAVDSGASGGGGRWQFGNALLTRLPVLSRLCHILPRPAERGIRHMTRQATEVTVASASGPLRIVNTHLEYHSLAQRLAQVDRLRDLQREALEERSDPPEVRPDGPYSAVPRPVDALLCGDFNMTLGSEEYRRLLAPLAGAETPFEDAWRIVHPGRDHDPTCGIFDRVQWPQGPHCRDFFFVAGDCARRLRALEIDTATAASDHQPLMLSLAD